MNLLKLDVTTLLKIEWIDLCWLGYSIKPWIYKIFKICNTMQNHAITCNTMQYHAIPCNTMQYNAIPCNTMQYHAIPCNTMQYYAIQCNAMLYHAIPCIINNCWRSVPLPCGQYNGHFYFHARYKKVLLFFILYIARSKVRKTLDEKQFTFLLFFIWRDVRYVKF